jgi:ATP:ADP antiporter, AAA family
MMKIFSDVFNIRKGEGHRALLMFFYAFLIIASLLITKPVRNSLFINRFGVEQLPYAFILVAVLAALVTLFYSRYITKINFYTLIAATTIGSIGCLFIFWSLLSSGFTAGWLVYFFYIWVAIFGVISTSQFWLLANYVFNAREAKRLFGFIGSGAISGGIFGGYITNFLAPLLGTQNMLLFCIAFLGICLIIQNRVWRSAASQNYREKLKQGRAARIKSDQNVLKLIFKSNHLIYMTSIVGIGVIVANLVDFQFSAIASDLISDKDKLTAFFGFWLSNLSIASLLFQLLFTGRVLNRFGVVTSLFFLPVGIIVGAVTILVFPGLFGAILIKVSDGGLKQSINKAGLELLNLPIPSMVKNKTKGFIDIFVDSLATGIGGLLLVLITSVFGMSIKMISILILLLVVLWLVFVVKIKKEYLNSFRLALEKRSIDLNEQYINIQDASIVNNFKKILLGNNKRQIQYVLKLLENEKGANYLPVFKGLLKNESAEIRYEALSLVSQYKNEEYLNDIGPLIYDENQDVRVSALRITYKNVDNNSELLEKLLSSKVESERTTALLCAAYEYRDNKAFREEFDLSAQFDKLINSIADNENSLEKLAFLKILMIKIIRISKGPQLSNFLNNFLQDKDIKVVKEAISAVGELRDIQFVPHLIKSMRNHHLRRIAREALAAFGPDILLTLNDILTNPNYDMRVRLAIPYVVSLIIVPESVDLLLSHIKTSNIIMRFEIIKAMSKLQRADQSLRFSREKVEKAIIAETDEYFINTALIATENKIAIKEKDDTELDFNQNIFRARNLLLTSLSESIDRNLEMIFRLLGLRYPAGDIFNIYKAIISEKSDLRANAIEFLDNLLDTQLKKIIILIVDSAPTEYLINQSNQLLKTTFNNEDDVLKYILKGDNIWLQMCAIHLISQSNKKEFLPLLNFMDGSSSIILNDTIQHAIIKLTNE